MKIPDNRSASLIAAAVFLLLLAGNASADVPVITTSSPLPTGNVGTVYSLTLAASGGTKPYTWSVTVGSLPPGLSLNPSTGILTGSPSAAGTFQFGITVNDSAKQSAAKTFNLTIRPVLVISTDSTLPAGIVGTPYSNTVAASGGSPPYQWLLSGGQLPQGLTLDRLTGVISGTPGAYGTFTFTIQVVDASLITTTRQFNLSVGLPNLPAVNITGLSGSPGPAQQLTVALSLSAAYPLPLTGQMNLSFQPDAVNSSDDPAIQFLTGGRTAQFTIPADTLGAVFSGPQMALQTGTVAGVITLSVQLSAGGIDLTPSPAPSVSIRIPRSAPKIQNVSIVRTSGGFEVRITGFAPERQVTRAIYQFTAASGQNLQTSSLTVPVDKVSDSWYQSSNSTAFGSQFTLIQPFTVQGTTAAIASVSTVLVNETGSSDSASVTF